MIWLDKWLWVGNGNAGNWTWQVSSGNWTWQVSSWNKGVQGLRKKTTPSSKSYASMVFHIFQFSSTSYRCWVGPKNQAPRKKSNCSTHSISLRSMAPDKNNHGFFSVGVLRNELPYQNWLVVFRHPSEKYESIGMKTFPIYGKNKKWQPNHQPEKLRKAPYPLVTEHSTKTLKITGVRTLDSGYSGLSSRLPSATKSTLEPGAFNLKHGATVKVAWDEHGVTVNGKRRDQKYCCKHISYMYILIGFDLINHGMIWEYNQI